MSKKDFQRLRELSKIGKQASKNLNPLIDSFNETLDIVLKNVPEEQKSEIETLKGVFSKSFNLAKMGKATEATELIKNYQNGRKNS